MIHISDPQVMTRIRKCLKNRKNKPLKSHIVAMLLPFDPPFFTGWDEYDDE